MKIVAGDTKTAKELGIPDVPPNRRYDYAGCEMAEEIHERTGASLWTVKHKWLAAEERSQTADRMQVEERVLAEERTQVDDRKQTEDRTQAA